MSRTASVFGFRQVGVQSELPIRQRRFEVRDEIEPKASSCIQEMQPAVDTGGLV